MKKFLIGLFLSLAASAFAQPVPPIVQSGSITPGHIATWTTNGVIQDGGASLTPGLVVGTTPIAGGTTGNCLTINVGILAQASCGSGGGGITIGSTTIAGGTTGRILYDNSGIVGELTTTGSGNAVLATAPSISGLIVTGSFTATGLVTNADLANASTTVNGVTCTLGSTCAPSIVSLANGITLTGGVNGGVLSQSGTTLAISTTLPGGLTLPSVVLTGSPSGAGANMTINGTSCLLGSSCTISAGIITIGTTQIANDTINAVLIVGAGHLLSETNVANNSVLVTSAGGVPSLSTTLPSGLAATNMTLTTPALGAATATSLTVSGTLNASGTFQIGGTAVALPISLTNGGTAAALTASNGGIVYSTASAFAVLAGTATPSQCLLSGASAAPTWGSCSGAAAVSSVTAANTTLTISPTTGAVVAGLNLGNANTWTAAQTFTNGDLLLKGSSSGAMTLEAPAVASTFVMTFPAATDTVAVLGTAQTFTAAQTFTNSDILLLGSSTGATTFTSANASATNYTLTIPAATTTLAVLGAINQTFTATNTFNGSVVIGTTGSFAIDGSSSGSIALVTQAAAGTYNFNLPITVGTAGQVLTSQGGGSTAMTWGTPPNNCVAVLNAVGDGSTDNTTVFNTALSALPSQGGCLSFGPGTFRFNSAISFTMTNGLSSLAIRGTGQDSTTLFWPSGNGLTINFANKNNSVHIGDLAFTTGSAAGTNTGLTLATTGAFVSDTESDLYRLTFRGNDGYLVADFWGTAISATGIQNLNAGGVFIDGANPSTPNGTGILFQGIAGSSIYSTVLNITDSSFNYLTVGFSYGSFVQGVTIKGSNFTGNTIGINVPVSETGALSQLTVTGNQFGQFAAGNSISISTAVAGLVIQGNDFGTSSGSFTSSAMDIVQSSNSTITGNTFIGSTGANSSGIIIGTQAATTGATISGNIIAGYHTGLSLQSGATPLTVTGNQFFANSTNISNAASGNYIASNPGYNPVGPGNITVTASPFTYTAGASPETVYIFNGTVSLVTNSPATVFYGNSTSTSYNLGPNESIIVTYSSLPTMSKSVH